MVFELSFILWISVFLQCIAVVLALRLIPVTGRALAWIIISSAFFLMAFRRTISLLFEEGLITSNWLHAISAESVALIISLFIVIGVTMIRRIFLQQKEDAEQVRKLSLAVEQNPGSTIIMDTAGVIEYVNSTFCRVSGYRAEEVIGTIPDILKPEYTSESVLNELKATMKSGGVWKGEFCNKTNVNGTVWEKACISPVKNDQNMISHYVVVLEDITKQKEQHEALEYLAMYDSLTNLPNRTLFYDRLEQAIHVARREKETLVVMLMDLNNFKEINDTLGHSTGDRVLKEISVRLQNIINRDNTIARMGGDEFLVLLPSSNYQQSVKLASKIISILKTPFILDHHSFEVGVSIGISVYPEDGNDTDTLLQHADVAMYSAKNTAESYMRYHQKLDDSNISQLNLTSELRNAVEQDQLVLHYQPKISFQSGVVDSVEALIRWQHPQRGLLPPDTFIPLAEKTGHIGLMTQWVIQNGLSQLSSWHKEGIIIGMSINISARDLLDISLPEYIQTELKRHKVKASLLTLEITESILMMYTQQTKEILKKLTNIGVRISIDDFGTGYSSLQHLKELPLNELKIDKSFVMSMINNEDDAIIVRSTIDLAHNLGLTVVAEGIENTDVYEILEIIQCDSAQGYFCAKPMEGAKLIKWFVENATNGNKNTHHANRVIN